MTQVLVITLDGTGESRTVSAGGLTVGRSQDNDWVLTDTAQPPAMSRKHCRFDIGPRGPTVTDLGSTNGTSVNGRVVVAHKPAVLRGGEVIEIGARRLSVEVRDTDAVPAQPPVLDPPGGAVRGLSVPRPVPPGAARLGETPMFRDPSRREPIDPLGSAFSDKLAPLPSQQKGPSQRTGRAEAPRTDGAPQLEAMVPRRTSRAPQDHEAGDPLAATKEPARSKRSGPAEEEDPFGFGASEKVTRGAAKPQELPPAKAEAPVPGADDPRAAFLIGAGVPPAPGDDRAAERFLEDAGRMFARLTDGLRELLAVRAIIKDQAGIDSTRISATLNNPLKLAGNKREAVAALLGKPEAGYLAPLAAIDAGFRDLKAHELAVLDGVQAAVDELLALFNPEALERNLDAAGLLANLLQGGRRARLWELYQERYEEIAKAARSRFMGRLDEAFRSGYSRKAAEIAAEKVPQS
ncbi:MAG TPA: type VI secretion system-associated FHA domain protein TagH [Rhodopila sp.]|nr:type VI secretion system-associated FHA domain protein TagH [Rhodopila sp.]